MPSPEERIAYLEGRVEEHTRGFEDLRTSLGRVDEHVLNVDRKVDAFREELGIRIEVLDRKVDTFREELGGRIDGLDRKVDRLGQELSSRISVTDQKVDRFRDELAGRIDGLDRKMSRQFTWIVGIQVAVLLAVMGSSIR